MTFLTRRCERCGLYRFDPRPLCTDCGGDRFTEHGLQGAGTVDSFTVVHRRDEEPYILARVRLAEGPILLTHLRRNPHPHCDQRVRMLRADNGLPYFIPVDDAE